LIWLGVEDVVEDEVAQVGSSHLVQLWIAQHPTHPPRIPGTVDGAELFAQVAGWPLDLRREQAIQIDRDSDGLAWQPERA
jgi:predicted oxidoreductase